MKLLKSNQGISLKLLRGKVEAAVAKQTPGHSLIVRTPQATAKVLGTKFVLDARKASTWLEVREGAVELAPHRDPCAPRAPGRAVTVEREHFAVAANGIPLRSNRLERRDECGLSNN